jgi:hypothetical protein
LIRPDQTGLIIEAVSFLKSFGASGSFVEPVPPSQTGAYTATFTDLEGNTSELREMCAGFGRGEIRTTVLTFGPVNARGKAREPRDSSLQNVTITNLGCSPLTITQAVIERVINIGRVTDKDDSAFFPVMVRGLDGVNRRFEAPVTIESARQLTLSVGFTPVIPGVVTADEEAGAGLSARDLLPGVVASRLTFFERRGQLGHIALTGTVTTGVKLIDPDRPENNPRVVLKRSGDQVKVELSIFDSNLNPVQPQLRVFYEFFDSNNRQIPLRVPSDDQLARTILDRKLLAGQSFTIIQRFANANHHPGLASVIVTVIDGEGASASAGASLSATVSSQTLRSKDSLTGAVVMPGVISFEEAGHKKNVKRHRRPHD